VGLKDFDSDDFLLTGVRKGNNIIIDNNRGLAAHAVADKPVTNLRIVKNWKRQKAQTRIVGVGSKTVTLDKNVNNEIPKTATISKKTGRVGGRRP